MRLIRGTAFVGTRFVIPILVLETRIRVLSRRRSALRRRGEWAESLIRSAMICRRGRPGTRLVRRHGRSVVLATSVSGGNYRVSAKIAGARRGCDGRTSMIFRGKVLPILTGE